MTATCVYRKVAQDGYGADWKTDCGYEIRMEAPIDVGFGFAPKPTDDGRKFCGFCGKPIELKEKL
ncbi:hypothetical protein [Paraburkholderia sp.]|uniref:hypothetical protein n=1 Tax=Paraburkholderia sp. TaxID=1926495 RepID=UPI0039E4F636